MVLDALYYPHAISLSPGLLPVIARLSDTNLSFGYDVVQAMAGSGAAPCFSANQNTQPEYKFTTSSVKSILDAVIADTEGGEVSASLVGGADAIMYFAKGKPYSMRVAAATAEHYTAVITANSMIVIDRITARQNQTVEVGFRLLIGRVDADTDPLVWTGSQALPAWACDTLYSMGPVLIDGLAVPGVKSWVYETNPTIERIESDGERSAGYLAVKEYKPKLTIVTNALSEVESSSYSGQSFSIATCYAKQRDPDGMYYAKASAVHIKMDLNPGLINRIVSVDGSPAEVQTELYPNVDGADPQLRTHEFATAVAHP